MQRALNALTKDRTAFVIAMRIGATVRSADTMLVLEDGELLTQDGLFAEMHARRKVVADTEAQRRATLTRPDPDQGREFRTP
jgi:ABC-type bacteriocin/lantibiotic exporter with double-glycine peptidase domain